MVTDGGIAVQPMRRFATWDRPALAWALLTLFVVMALVAGLPAFHASVGLTQTDAIDQGITVPSVRLLPIALVLLASLLAARLVSSGRSSGDRARSHSTCANPGSYCERPARDARSCVRMLAGLLRAGSADPDALTIAVAVRNLGTLRVAPSRRGTGGFFVSPKAVLMRI